MTAPPRDHLGIVELVGVCDEFRQWFSTLFEVVGAWVPTTDDPMLQRVFATACHRHAWHARLWDDRAPSIPVDPPTGAASEPPVDADPVRRPGAYRAQLDELLHRCGALEARLDGELDPSTMRVIGLVRNDLADLRTQLTAAGH